MKILIASTPATGHINPLLSIGRILIAEGHEISFLTGSFARQRVEAIGAKFHSLPKLADFDLRDYDSVDPEIKRMVPGPDLFRHVSAVTFIDPIPHQHEALQQLMKSFQPDLVVADGMFFGMLPQLLGARSKRPPIILCSTSILHCSRQDGAPHFLGLPPANSVEEEKIYAELFSEHERLFYKPTGDHLNKTLHSLGVGHLNAPLFGCMIDLADVYFQLTIPSLEFPGNFPKSVQFIGALPVSHNQVKLPSWANEIDGSRKVILVTQGTLANYNFDQLIMPTLKALASEPDILVIATTGGRSIDSTSGPIPSNARLSEYLPFDWILPKIDVLVTNGGFGSVNEALSFGIPIVSAGMTEDKSDVGARVAWSGAGINLKSNEPTQHVLKEAILEVISNPTYRSHAARMAKEFAEIDTRSKILQAINKICYEPLTDNLEETESKESVVCGL